MSTGLIIAIIIVAIIVIAAVVMLPRMRENARRREAERELHSRREAVAEEHRSAASERELRAERAEQQARMAEQAAERERAEANMQRERAEMHERGMADDELIDEHERDRFADVAGTPPTDRDQRDLDGDGHTLDDRTRVATDRDPVDERSDRDPAAAPGSESTSPDYERGREDDNRFERTRLTEDVRDSERARRD